MRPDAPEGPAVDFEWWWLFFLVPLAVIPLFGVLIVAVGMWEKQPIQPFAVPEKGQAPKETDYARRMNDAAEDARYDHLGMACDTRGGLYGLRFDFWASADRSVFVVVCGGKLARIPYKGTWVYSPLPDDRTLTTTDDIGSADISGASEMHIWPNASFRQLLDRHIDRLEELTDEPLPFAMEDPLRAFIAIRARRAEMLVERGLGKYTDSERTAVRYTFRGAVRYYVVGTWLQPLGRLARSVGLSR
jgi:hypothetical protein